MDRLNRKKTEFQKDVAIHARAIKFIFTYSREWSVMGITILMDSIYPFISIYLSSLLLQALYEGQPLQEMMGLALAGAGTALLVTLTRHLAAKYKNVLWWSMRFRTEEPVMKKAMEMDYELMEDLEVQNLRARQEEYRRHGSSAFEIFIWQIELFFDACIKLILSLATIWPLLAGFGPLSLLPGAVLATGLFLVRSVSMRASQREYRWDRETADQERLDSFLMSQVAYDREAGKDIRLFHQQDLLTRYGERTITGSQELARKTARSRIGCGFAESLWAAVLGGIAWLGTALKASTGAIPVGSVVRYAGGIQQMVQAITHLLACWDYLHANRERMEEFFAYLDLPEKKKRGTIPVQKRRDGRFLIEFRNVSFRYPGTENWVLKNLNLRFEIGERVALVGQNGSGKTTFVKLLCRLYDPTEGVILMNDVDIRKYRYGEYMRLFSVVFQDFQIFSFKIGEYIAGSEQVDEKRALDALERAGLTGLLSKMPEGLDTMVGRDFSENGFLISGGEAQKLAMARAIYKNAPFVILDEPTAALDPVAENEIYTRFHEVIGQRTALFISHRLSACRFAREILVFEGGNIVQRGSHETLCETPGLYQRMWKAQAQYYQA